MKSPVLATIVALAACLSVNGGGSAPYVSKAEYLDLMEAAVSAYSDERFAQYVAEVERDGVQEHGFPRLTANIGVLLANGRQQGRRDAFRHMMDMCCRDAKKGKMPKEGNEFSVKELAIAFVAVEKAGLFEKGVVDAWRADLRAVDAQRCYKALPPIGADRAYNWCVFGCASEQARIAAELGGDAAHVEKYVSDQLRWFDANGMYKDPHQPAVYDVVTRLQFMAILHYGYNGPSRAKLEELLDRAAEPTLAMLSAAGEIPYGGRSNQFLHNHTFYSGVCEWYAARYHAQGDDGKAARFRRAAREAVDALRRWLDVRPVRHVKNFYPTGAGKRGTGMGCEGYAYFDKYMITMGSWAMLSWLFADESVPVMPPEAAKPVAFASTPDFHVVLLRAGDYSAQFDYNADTHYDCDGLGRVQRKGAPPTICMSVPCAEKPSYAIERPNAGALSILPVGDGVLAPDGSGVDGDCAWANWKKGDKVWKCRLSPKGMDMTLSGAGAAALTLPAFEFDGEQNSEITCDGKSLTVRYRGWLCSYSTDGAIVDTGDVCSNRNGRYRVFKAQGNGALMVHIAISQGKTAGGDSSR